ncbi:AbgT family transporter [Alkalihalobacterium sp. APHAB7]|uniref:AbgT family transporter n=1 Tax=Alkalihalobacterium sp. APHAB7 TaxID=3402081 RepID=UPI003AB0F23F
MSRLQLENENEAKIGPMMKFLNVVERVGNKLPHPFMLFVYLAAATMVFSAILSFFNVSVFHPGTEEEVHIKSLISGEGLQYITGSMVSNFSGFAPLGLVLTMMLGIGIAQKVGLFEAFMKKTILNTPKSLVTYAVITAGVLGNLASDAAYIIIPPLAAMVFYAIGRHPFAGLAAGFAGVGAGFTANFIVAGTDALLSGISTEVAKTVDPTVIVTPVDNYFFMSASVVMLVIVGALVTEKIIEPRLGTYTGKAIDTTFEVTKEETKALRRTGIAAVAYLGLLAMVVLPASSPLRAEDGGLVPSPFISGIVPIILFFFITLAIVYGASVGKIKNTSDVPTLMGEAMKDMSGYIVLVFAVAQFIAYFNWSNIGIWMAVSFADLLQSVNMTGLPVIIGFILLTAILNLFIISGSAQWALMAPVFIPMFMIMGYDPAFVQLGFRIADSSTNIISPLNPYIPMLLMFMKDYDKKAGFGTLFSLMLPFSIFFLGAWIVLLIIWVLVGLPIGPGITM